MLTWLLPLCTESQMPVYIIRLSLRVESEFYALMCPMKWNQIKTNCPKPCHQIVRPNFQQQNADKFSFLNKNNIPLISSSVYCGVPSDKFLFHWVYKFSCQGILEIHQNSHRVIWEVLLLGFFFKSYSLGLCYSNNLIVYKLHSKNTFRYALKISTTKR